MMRRMASHLIKKTKHGYSDDGDSYHEIMLFAKPLFENQAAPYNRKGTVGGYDGSRENDVLRVRDSEDIEELTDGL